MHIDAVLVGLYHPGFASNHGSEAKFDLRAVGDNGLAAGSGTRQVLSSDRLMFFRFGSYEENWLIAAPVLLHTFEQRSVLANVATGACQSVNPA
jgi:hypothetical protein